MQKAGVPAYAIFCNVISVKSVGNVVSVAEPSDRNCVNCCLQYSIFGCSGSKYLLRIFSASVK